MITTKYFGPVYYWGTNTELEYKGSNTIIQSTKMMKLREISQSRLK
jgi:hypothetical protein